MEIERKWLVNGWPPPDLPLLFEQDMRQGYISVHPTVRIRQETMIGNSDQAGEEFILCFKSSGGLSRKEIEFPISREIFTRLEDLIALPLIRKIRRTYLLPDGCHLEVNHVDIGQPGEFWYAEIEYRSEEEALSWEPESRELADYLKKDVTSDPSQTMGAYWLATRGG